MFKILVVDDDPGFRKIVGEFLKRAGYAVRVVNDGQEAMKALKKDKPDLMVLDVMMPGMSGYEVSHHVKADALLEDLPIILLTSQERVLDLGLSMALGIDYLHKSSSLKILIAKIERILNKPEGLKTKLTEEIKDPYFRELLEHDRNVAEGIKRIIDFRVKNVARQDIAKNAEHKD